jgi:putative acetyltransferase
MAGLRHATTPHDYALARELFVEYSEGLGIDLCFQGFAEELATLPGAYAPPRGRLLLAGEPGTAFGCVALRPLAAHGDGQADDAPIGEVKRLYVRPGQRGGGWGYRLASALIAEARTIGYRELKLDTLGSMTAARALYARLGFRECAAYYRNPHPEVVYMSRPLSGAATDVS